jgi:hypothetical protein
MNRAERISKLALKFSKLRTAIIKEGLADVSEKMTEPAMLLVKYGLEAYEKEYRQQKEE